MPIKELENKLVLTTADGKTFSMPIKDFSMATTVDSPVSTTYTLSADVPDCSISTAFPLSADMLASISSAATYTRCSDTASPIEFNPKNNEVIYKEDINLLLPANGVKNIMTEEINKFLDLDETDKALTFIICKKIIERIQKEIINEAPTVNL